MFFELMIIIADESDLAGDAGAPPAEKYYDYADYDCGDAPSPCCSGRYTRLVFHPQSCHINPISSMRPIRPISPITPSLYNPL